MSSAELEKYLSSLSDEEREEFKDLIEETKKREDHLEEITKRTRANIEELTKRWMTFNKGLNDLSTQANNVKDRINNLLLNLQDPGSKTYH